MQVDVQQTRESSNSYSFESSLALRFACHSQPIRTVSHSDLKAHNGNAADVRVVLELNRDQSVGLRIPVAGGGRVEPRAVILLQNARYHVLELLAQLRESFEDEFDNLLGPLAGFVPVEGGVLVDEDLADCFLRDLLHLFGVEVSVVFEICHDFVASNLKVLYII